MLAKYEPLRYLLTFWNNRQKRKVSRTPSLQETASSVYSSEPSCSISASTSKQTWSRTRVVTAYRRRRRIAARLIGNGSAGGTGFLEFAAPPAGASRKSGLFSASGSHTSASDLLQSAVNGHPTGKKNVYGTRRKRCLRTDRRNRTESDSADSFRVR